MANIDADIFAAIMCEQCPDLELCAPKRLAGFGRLRNANIGI
jgi:hypothetical protein